MLSSSFDFDSIRKKGLDLTAKCFPNNYSNLSDRLDFAPNNSQRLAEQTSDLYPKCSCTTEAELRLASMRIFATIMLNAWRRRREDVKRLLVKVEELKKGTQKAKNKIHVYNTLFRVEQKRNDELSCQLKCSIESVMHAKSSCENLSTSVISLEAERLLLEQDLTNKSKELEALTDILSQTKEQLLQSMIDQHNLRFTLNKEQRLVQELENQKNKLINELYQLTNESRETEHKYRTELVRKEVDLERSNAKVSLLEEMLNGLKEKSQRVDECTANDARLREEIESLHKMGATLQQALDNTFGKRMSAYWKKMYVYQHKSFHFAQTFLYYLLPAVPHSSGCSKLKNI